MRKNNNTWTMIDIVKGKTIWLIILTALLTKLMNDAANKGLNYYLNSFNEHPLYTPIYSFGKYGLILIIPAALISIGIIKMFLKVRKAPAPVSVNRVEVSNVENKSTQESRFKWYSLYGFALGCLLYAYGWIPLFDYFSKTIANDYAQIGILLVGTFGGIVAMFYLARYINKQMVKVTNTNKELLHDIERGVYDAEIAHRSVKKDDIVTALERGWATTFKGVIIYLSIRNWLIKTVKFFTLAVVAVFTALVAIGTFLATFLSSGINRSSSSSSNSGYASERDAAFQKHQRNKEEKDYRGKKLARQLNYNSNYAGNEMREYKRSKEAFDKSEIETRKYY